MRVGRLGRRDFRRVFAEGQSVADPLAVLYWRPGGPGVRAGVAVARAVRGAVCRNRLRRRWREAIRRAAAGIAPGVDLVVLARSAGCEAAFGELESSLGGLLARAGLCGEWDRA